MTAEREPQLVSSIDRTAITTRCLGDAGGVPVLLCNAVGANLDIWSPVIDGLTSDRRLIAWDMRGMFESGPSNSDRLDAWMHAHDGIAAARAWGAERFHLLAWSSGGRIALEIASRFPERVVSLSMICAGYGHPLSGLLRLDLSSLLPRLAGLTRFAAAPLHGLLKNLVQRPEVVGLVRQSGAIAGTADTQAFVAYLRGLAQLDPSTLFRTYHAVSGDAAPDLLGEVIAPTLIIAGEHDQFTSRSTTTELVAKIDDARLEIYEDATHYLPIEHPERLAHDLVRFFKEIENVGPRGPRSDL